MEQYLQTFHVNNNGINLRCDTATMEELFVDQSTTDAIPLHFLLKIGLFY